MAKRATKQMARDTVSALLEAIEALVAQGSLQAGEVQGLLRRTIEHLPEPERSLLMPAVVDAARPRVVKAERSTETY
jgi:ribosomal protein S12 methylthiotransferase accessory factor YcaO